MQEKLKERNKSQRRLYRPATERNVSRNRVLYSSPRTKTEAFSTINAIYKPKLASLDGLVHELKLKKKYLAHLEVESMLLDHEEEKVKVEKVEECSISDSSEEIYDTSNPKIVKTWNEVKCEKKKLFEILMFQDTLKHMLERDQQNLYRKKIRIQQAQKELKSLISQNKGTKTPKISFRNYSST